MANPTGQASRKRAWTILNDLDRSGLTLDRVMDDAQAEGNMLSRRDQALVHSLVFGVLRWRGRLDWILSQFSRTRLAKIDPPVLNLLRLGLYQIVFLSRVPTAAAVNTAVDLAKTAHPPWVVKFVNGVLRAAVRGHADLAPPSAEVDPVAALAVEKSFPPWMIRRWVDRFGAGETAALCDAVNGIPPITLRTNTQKTDRQALLTELSSSARSAVKTLVAPDGIALEGLNRPLTRMAAFERGDFAVQDEAAQLVSLLTNPEPGQRVLDACAGLGGKTGHLGQLMDDRGELVAMDRSAEKLSRLQSEMARLGITCVSTRVHDAAAALNSPPFDRVLLDAPCTGLGVLRRNPDGKWARRPEDIARCAREQKRLLNALAPAVKPGGCLIYSVCSMEEEENGEVVRDFLARHADFSRIRQPGGLPAPAETFMDADGLFRTFPHRHAMDGFFAAVLKRNK